MSKGLNAEDLEKARAQALLSHQLHASAGRAEDGQSTGRPQGLVPHLVAWKNAAVETTKKYLGWTAPIGRLTAGAAVGGAKGLAAHARWLAYPTGKDGQRHFNPKHLLFGLAADALLIAAAPIIAAGGYYHATLQAYDIYVPNAGVFVNQQFTQPNQVGHVIAPRDEIFTVLAQDLNAKNKVEPIRFDVDSNAFFFYKKNAMRPDLLAAEMVPISPYGASCRVEATGAYTRLPRPLRVGAVKWLDLRPEIVDVVGECKQLPAVPQQYVGLTPAAPVHAVPVQTPAPHPPK